MARQDHNQQDLRVDHNRTNVETSVHVTPDISLAKKGNTQTKSEIENKTTNNVYNNSNSFVFFSDNKIGNVEQPVPTRNTCIIL